MDQVTVEHLTKVDRHQAKKGLQQALEKEKVT